MGGFGCCLVWVWVMFIITIGCVSLFGLFVVAIVLLGLGLLWCVLSVDVLLWI